MVIKANEQRTNISNGGEPKVAILSLELLTPNPENPRKHSRAQVRALAKSITAFGFAAPILIDGNRQIIAGHGRYEAAKYLGLPHVPVIFLDRLTDVQAKAYALADNQLAGRSSWDEGRVATQLKELSELALDFDIEAIGFELPEIDFRIQSLDASDTTDMADEFEVVAGSAVSQSGDLWQLGPHRLYCRNALDGNAYAVLMESEKAAGVFTDPPYNVKIDGHVCGKGSIRHREFAMAAGEMTEREVTQFLGASLASGRMPSRFDRSWSWLWPPRHRFAPALPRRRR